MTQQAHGLAVWPEPNASGAAIQAAFWRKDAGPWDLTTTGPAQGRTLDDGDGAFTLFDVSSPYVLISDGAGGYQLSASGTAAAVLADDGAGGLKLSTTLTDKAASLYPDAGRGDVYPVRDDANELNWALIGDHYQSY